LKARSAHRVAETRRSRFIGAEQPAPRE